MLFPKNLRQFELLIILRFQDFFEQFTPCRARVGRLEIGNRVVWQQAAGDTDRDYSQYCVRWGVILNGPGEEGPWPACEKPLREKNWSSKKITDLKRFAEEMKNDDIVVLRLGTAKVLAVGEIVGDYFHDEQFSDVDGWTVQQVRRVRWLWHDLNSPKEFKTYALKQGDTTQKLNKGKVFDWLQGLPINPANFVAPLPQLPSSAVGANISLEEISDFLFDKGVASSSISSLLTEIGELIRIAKWYNRAVLAQESMKAQEGASDQKDSQTSENETVTYLVVPLLRALGWTPQRMAVEWKRVDVALFTQLPRGDKNLQVVVEAKKMGNSCLAAKSQANSYAVGKPGCYRLIVTDGLRYGIFTKDNEGDFKIYAYLNLTDMKRHYPILECHGAAEALLSMSPEWRLDQMRPIS